MIWGVVSVLDWKVVSWLRILGEVIMITSQNYNKQLKCVFLLFCSCKVLKHRSDIGMNFL